MASAPMSTPRRELLQDTGKLFKDDALYLMARHREPWRGRDGIIAGWLDHRDEPAAGPFGMSSSRFAGDLAFVRRWTDYSDGDRFSNLWVIRLDEDGRCSEFMEWWMEIK
jgi:hypothetical protein